jgi:hypothetical protein
MTSLATWAILRTYILDPLSVGRIRAHADAISLEESAAQIGLSTNDAAIL